MALIAKEGYISNEKRKVLMSEEDQDDTEERPCLHCLIVELVDNFFAEYAATEGGEPDTIDTDVVITAVAKTVAELTSGQDSAVRQNIIEQLTREIMDYDAEFRQQDAMGTPRSDARH
jgi:hypothetical protein